MPPLAGFSAPAVQQRSARISARAAAAGAVFGYVFTAFAEHEAQYTLVNVQDPPGSGIPDFHPNATGYAAIAARLAALVMPQAG